MEVQNRLQKKKTEIYENVQTAVYEVAGQKIELTPEVVRNYMVSGDKEKVTIKEVMMFMNLCKFSGLNPWAKEAYLIKYGNEPATMVVRKEAYLKRAEANESFDGFESGIITINEKAGTVSHREGCIVFPGEQVAGGWAKVYRKDRSHPYVAEVGFEEYVARKKDGTPNSMWSKKPGTMIRKVALVQALREAFPSSFGGAFTEEEGDNMPEIAADVYASEQTVPAIEQREPMPTMPRAEEKEPLPVMPEPETKEPAPDQEGDFFA